MISWSKDLYLGESVKNDYKKVVKKITEGKFNFQVYLIAFASNPCNLFDIIPACELKLPHYKNCEVHILGLAKGKEEAEVVVRDMIAKVYKDTGAFDVRRYFA